MFTVTKTYGHERGLSACFRQPLATSHCRYLHGYALAFSFEFAAHELDKNNWVIDFGSLKPLKQFLDANFDHKTIVAEADPEMEMFVAMEAAGIVDLNVLPYVGCEAFAEYAGKVAAEICDLQTQGRAWLAHCKVSEHGSNSASWYPGIK